MSDRDTPAIGILGPTGSGKSRLALMLSKRLGGEIINCDALQVYRHMDIGTAKATAAERADVPHHLLDLCEPDEDFSAGDYMRLGRAALKEIAGRGAIPVVAGGTGFYFRALIRGLFEGPGRDEALRRRMRRIIERRGSASLHRALSRVDPDAARRIAPGDASRILRAYEVWLQSGKPMSWWQNQPGEVLTGYNWLFLAIDWPRPQLYDRINRRVLEMFERGFVEEVQRLLARYPRDCHALRAIGYRQIAGYLEGLHSMDAAIEETQRESRHYAKRQLTWFRAEKDIRWLAASRGLDSVVDEALRLGLDFVLNQAGRAGNGNRTSLPGPTEK